MSVPMAEPWDSQRLEGIKNTYHPILLFCFFTIKFEQEAFRTFNLNKKGLVPHPVTLGEHLRNRRLTLKLRQEHVARQFGTLREVYDRWERDQREPVVSEWPGILSFLGYYPFSQETAADLVLKARRCQGADQKHFANLVGVVHQQLRQWEHGSEFPDEGTMGHLTQLAQLPGAMLL